MGILIAEPEAEVAKSEVSGDDPGVPETASAKPSEVGPNQTTVENQGSEKTAANPISPAVGTAKKKKKKKKKKATVDPFADFHEFQQPVKNIPHHRVLAINRGERAGQLKVEIQPDDAKLLELAHAALVPENHVFAEFLKKCAAEALSKVLVPSLEREIRRELTEAAERHAVEVFASNLRNLLLQPPIHDRCVLAIDPGFKRGCSVAVLDSLGQVLDSGHLFVVGNPGATGRKQAKTGGLDQAV